MTETIPNSINKSKNVQKLLSQLVQHYLSESRVFVKELRKIGYSWEKIGKLAGYTKQAAQDKYDN